MNKFSYALGTIGFTKSAGPPPAGWAYARGYKTRAQATSPEAQAEWNEYMARMHQINQTRGERARAYANQDPWRGVRPEWSYASPPQTSDEVDRARWGQLADVQRYSQHPGVRVGGEWRPMPGVRTPNPRDVADYGASRPFSRSPLPAQRYRGFVQIPGRISGGASEEYQSDDTFRTQGEAQRWAQLIINSRRTANRALTANDIAALSRGGPRPREVIQPPAATAVAGPAAPAARSAPAQAGVNTISAADWLAQPSKPVGNAAANLGRQGAQQLASAAPARNYMGLNSSTAWGSPQSPATANRPGSWWRA